MKWKVELTGDTVLLRTLCSDFNPSEEINVFEEAGHFFMTKIEFENLINADEVRQLSTDIIELINGISFYVNGKKGTICSNSISSLNVQGGNDIFVYVDTSFLYLTSNQPSLIIANEDGSIIQWSPLTTMQNLLTSARTNPTKAKIFRLYASGNLDWVSLYRLYEVVYSDIGDLIFSWIDETKIKNFKHTCNSIDAIGDNSRHGLEKNEPPKKPITLTDAQNLIKQIIDKYLEMK